MVISGPSARTAKSTRSPTRRRLCRPDCATDAPVHIVARWHGHDPAVLLSIYSDANANELRAAGASLFG